MHKTFTMAVIGAVLSVPALAVAQSVPTTGEPKTQSQDETTTTTTTLIGTPPPPGESTTTTTTTTSPDDPAAGGDASPEEPPDQTVEVPTPKDTTPSGVVRNIRHEMFRQQQAAALAASAAQANLGAAYHELASLRGEEERLTRNLLDHRRAERQAAGGALEAKTRFRARAVNAYVEGPGQLAFIMEANDPNELLHRTALTTSVLEADRDGWIEARDLQSDLSDEVTAMVSRLTEVRQQLDVRRQDVAALNRQADQQRSVLAMFQAGSQIAIAGFVFPVGDPHHYVDTFGAPRMVGTEYEHSHQGTDIFAPHGTPLFAVERGVITRVGTDVLGGTKLWLTGSSGVRYYYAHLSGYAEGIAEGTVVDAGQVVGFVGNTGNALSTPPHLHFEVHPRDGMAVNPYPILAVTDRFQGSYRTSG